MFFLFFILASKYKYNNVLSLLYLYANLFLG